MEELFLRNDLLIYIICDIIFLGDEIMANKRNYNKRKKSGKKKEDIQVNEFNLRKSIYAVIGILCFFGLFFLITFGITNNNSEKKEENENNEVSISYDEILLGRSLSMGDEEYLVIFYDSSNEEDNNNYSSLVSNYRNKEGHLNLYYVDMNKTFNKKFLTTEESNKTPTDTASMKINGPTLIRVNGGNVTEYLEGLDSINSVLA